MQEIGDLPLHKNFEHDEDKDALENLVSLLEEYGLEDEEELPIRDGGEEIDVEALYKKLPERLSAASNTDQPAINSAREELKDLCELIPQKDRIKDGGFWVSPEWVLERLFDRLEPFSDFADKARTCRGVDCPVYSECPYADLPRVKGASPQDDQPCLVDRDVIKGVVDELIAPNDPDGGKIDPRRPVQMMLLETLVMLMLEQSRIWLKLESDEITVEHREALQVHESGVEQFVEANEVEHPLLERLDKVQHRINETMQRMGISPEFEMRQDRWIEDEDNVNAEVKGKNFARRYLRDASEEIKDQLKEGTEAREVAEQIVEDARKRLEEAEDEGNA